MPSKQEKRRRKELVNSIEQKQRAEAEANLPLSRRDLLDLFIWVDDRWDQYGCDRTLRHTLEFIKLRGLAEERIIEWLAEQGGYCDCEVLGNVVERWIDDPGAVRQWKFEGQ